MLHKQCVWTHQSSLTVCVDSNHNVQGFAGISTSSFATKTTMSAEAGFYIDFGWVPPIYFRRLFGSLPSRYSNLSTLRAALDIVLLI